MKRTWFITLAFAAAACGDSTGPQGDPLSRAEASVLAMAILASGETVTASAGGSASTQAPSGLDAAPIEFSNSVQVTHPCPAGGEVAFDVTVDGTADDETGSFSFDLTGTQVHDACGYPGEAGTITVTGAPSLLFTASAAMVNQVPSEPFTFTVDGAVDWTSEGGREGRCPISIDAVTDFGARTRTLDAQVCGHTIRQTFTWQAQ